MGSCHLPIRRKLIWLNAEKEQRKLAKRKLARLTAKRASLPAGKLAAKAKLKKGTREKHAVHAAADLLAPLLSWRQLKSKSLGS
jgi:hypothetical protein